jgi:hypothetical protein
VSKKQQVHVSEAVSPPVKVSREARKKLRSERTVGNKPLIFQGIWVVGPRTGELKQQDPLPFGRGDLPVEDLGVIRELSGS